MNVVIQIKRQFVSIASADRFGNEYELVNQYTDAHALVMPTRKPLKEAFLKPIAERFNVRIADLILITI